MAKATLPFLPRPARQRSATSAPTTDASATSRSSPDRPLEEYARDLEAFALAVALLFELKCPDSTTRGEVVEWVTELPDLFLALATGTHTLKED